MSSQAPVQGLLHASGARKALGGFFVSGMLLSFLGAILPAWGYHLTEEYLTVGAYFFCATLGIVTSVWLARTVLAHKGVGWMLTVGCAVACSALLFLAAVSPPFAAWWRMIGLFAIGVAAGMLHIGIFQAISPIYQHDPAATVNVGGILFGGGCLATALLVSGTFYVYTVPSIQILIAIVPGIFAVVYGKARFEAQPVPQQPSIRQMLHEMRSPGAVLFSLLLFFQFGNEWAIAGWLTLFLIDRLGISPEAALLLLAVYWMALIVGRVVAQAVLPGSAMGGFCFAACPRSCSGV